MNTSRSVNPWLNITAMNTEPTVRIFRNGMVTEDNSELDLYEE